MARKTDKEKKKKTPKVKKPRKSRAKPKSEHKKDGRPTDYKRTYPKIVYKLCLLGMIDKELAKFFGVGITALNSWKKKHLKFKMSISEGREMADANVTLSLYKRATGAVVDDTYFSSHQGKVTATKTKKHYPPETRAAEIWLTNRQRKRWATEEGDSGEQYKEPSLNISVSPSKK